MVEEVKKAKSRHQSTFEYFETLQIECICADLRARIYPRTKDKEYWRRVKEGKRIKIESIAEKNHGLPTIFSDSGLRNEIENRFFREKGHPNFTYPSDEKKQVQEPLDLLYYYGIGVDVRCDLYGEVKVGKVKSFTPYSQSITIMIDDKPHEFPISEVTRIL